MKKLVVTEYDSRQPDADGQGIPEARMHELPPAASAAANVTSTDRESGRPNPACAAGQGVAENADLPGEDAAVGMERVLVSACLLGRPVRYAGDGAVCDHSVLLRWIEEGRVVAFCPEVAGGLPTPRPPAEIEAAARGTLVLSGQARVLDVLGQDVTAAFVNGARQAVLAAGADGVRIAVLKDGSPSCGSGYTYDGSFTGARVPHMGVAAAALQAAGVRVFSESRLDEAAAYLGRLGHGHHAEPPDAG